jgi:hypothetical protein
MSAQNHNISRRSFLTTALASAACLLGSYSVFIERYIVEFNRYRISVPNLPPVFSGLKILHITDLHYGPLLPLFFVEMLMGKIAAAEKDVIVCTGDYIHSSKSPQAMDTIWPLLCELKAPLGVFSVLGNHDLYLNRRRSQHWLEKSGQGLRKKALAIDRGGRRLWFAGAGDYLEDHYFLDEVLHIIPRDDCRIVLAHNPDSADSYFKERSDLMLCGHTHGGQVSLPFYGPPIVPVLNKNYTSGLKRSRKDQLVFISRGIGWAHFPVRFNCLPEIPILELVPA